MLRDLGGEMLVRLRFDSTSTRFDEHARCTTLLLIGVSVKPGGLDGEVLRMLNTEFNDGRADVIAEPRIMKSMRTVQPSCQRGTVWSGKTRKGVPRREE